MGKNFSNNKLKLVFFLFLTAMLACFSNLNASSTELELFDRGYENYLSYQPEKSIEAFELFLREFPNSSAGDAALFWLGKSYISTGSIIKAKDVFLEIKTDYPESPFIFYAEKEIEAINKREAEIQNINPLDILEDEESDSSKEELEEKDIDIRALKEEYAEIVKRNGALEVLLSEERMKSENLGKKITELESLMGRKDNELSKVEKERDDLSRLFADANTRAEELSARIKEFRKEENKAKSNEDVCRAIIEENDNLKSLLENEKTKNQNLQEKIQKLENNNSFFMQSSYVLHTLGVKDSPWRYGNIQEDLITEKILFEEAKAQNISVDMELYKELLNKHQFNEEQADYLYKYLVICSLVDAKLKSLPAEIMVEIIKIIYDENDKYRKTVLAPELQKLAKSGMPFDKIYRSYAEEVDYSFVYFDELEDWVKERIDKLQPGEIGVIWSDDGFMVLKPFLKELSYRAFEQVDGETYGRLKSVIKKWIDDLRKKTG